MSTGASDEGGGFAGFGSDFNPSMGGLGDANAIASAPLEDLVGGMIGAAQATSTIAAEATDNSDIIMGLPVMMKVVLGSAKMPVSSLAKLAKGSVVKLDKMVGDPVDILVNGRLIARGEVVVLNEGTSQFGIVLTQVGGLAPQPK